MGDLYISAMYAPGSQAQHRICGMGSRGPASPIGQSIQRGRQQFRSRRGPGFDVGHRIGQSHAVSRGEGRIHSLGPQSRLPWDQGGSAHVHRFPGQALQGSSQDIRGQGHMGFPDMGMPTFGDQMSQQGLGGQQSNTFTALSGQQGFGHSQRSIGIDEQRFVSGQSIRGQSQGQPHLVGQFPSRHGFPSGQRAGAGQNSFDQGHRDFSQPQSSFSGPSFGSQSFGGQTLGGRPLSGQSFGQLPTSAAGGMLPQHFLVEQPPVSVTSINGGQGQLGASQQQPMP